MKWYREDTKDHICIWSDVWMTNALKNRKNELITKLAIKYLMS